MTHTEDSLMALADDYGREIADCPNMPTPVERKLCAAKIERARDALRLAIREVLAEKQQAALNSISAFAQADENFARAEKAEAECERLRKDAERYQALVWADGLLVEGGDRKIDGYWEYKPAVYDGLKCNRYYLGDEPRSFEECADFAVEKMRAAMKEQP